MYQLFGVIPLAKILSIVLLVTYLSFLIGKLITNNKTKNVAIDFLIGLFFLFGLIASYITYCQSVFLPVIIGLPLLFKTRIQFDKLKALSIQSLRDVAKFGLIFCAFFLIELFRQDYFNKEFVNSSWADYSFYLTTVRNILKSGVEGSFAYLNDYSIDYTPNIYHFFDLYILTPIFLFKIPPLIGYLFLYLPFAYSLSAFCLIYLFDDRVDFFRIILAVIVIHYLGFNFSETVSEQRFSIVYCHKSALLFIPFLLFKLTKLLSKSDSFVLLNLITLSISPIVFMVCFIPLLVYLFTPLSKISDEFKNLLNVKNLVVFLVVLFYVFTILNPKSDNSNVFTDIEIESTSLVEQITNQVKSTFSTFKLLPQFAIFCVFLLIQVVKDKQKVPKVLLLSFGTLVSGTLLSFVFFHHYDGTQFFVIPLIALLALTFYYSVIQFVNKSIIYGRLLGIVSICIYLVCFSLSGHAVYSTPRALNKSSLGFTKQIMPFVKSGNTINSVFLPSLDYRGSWVIAMPHFPIDVGYLNYFSESKCVQPFSSSFFTNNDNYQQNALQLISKGPFHRYCEEMKLKPTSYYDRDFELGILGFIEKYSINTVILHKELETPKWLEKLGVVKILRPQKSYDKHVLYILSSE